MKKINLLLVALVMLVGSSFAQTEKKAVWAELKAFHTLMAGTFHPSEEGNLVPLKEKAEDLYKASKVWYASEIPADFKPEETKATIEKLMIKCNDIWAAVVAKKSDEELKKMIADAHDIFHKVVGECKKGSDGHQHR
jgi:hypothetical protein